MQRAHCVEAGPGTPSVGYAKRETISQPARLESSLLIVASFPLAETLTCTCFWAEIWSTVMFSSWARILQISVRASTKRGKQIGSSMKFVSLLSFCERSLI